MVKTFDVVKQQYIQEKACFKPEDGTITGLERQEGYLIMFIICCLGYIMDPKTPRIQKGHTIVHVCWQESLGLDIKKPLKLTQDDRRAKLRKENVVSIEGSFIGVKSILTFKVF